MAMLPTVATGGLEEGAGFTSVATVAPAPAAAPAGSRLAAPAGRAPDRRAPAAQVHGANVARADAPGHYPACDALVPRIPGLALAISGADCLPILLLAPGAVAVVHAGWRGLAAGAPRATLSTLCETAGVSPRRVQVHFGPCIRPCCYEVGS